MCSFRLLTKQLSVAVNHGWGAAYGEYPARSRRARQLPLTLIVIRASACELRANTVYFTLAGARRKRLRLALFGRGQNDEQDFEFLELARTRRPARLGRSGKFPR